MQSLLLDSRSSYLKVNHLRLDTGSEKIDLGKLKNANLVFSSPSGYITIDALRWLTYGGASISFLDSRGEMYCSLVPSESKVGKVRIQQYKAYCDRGRKLSIAKAFVEGRAQTSGLEDFSSIKRVQDSKALLLAEGSLTAQIFREFTNAIRTNPSFKSYLGRKGNNPSAQSLHATNPVNAMLNYGYSILAGTCRKAIAFAGLDAQIGFLHEMAPYKTPLVYDFQELGRSLVERATVGLVREKKVTLSDFIRTQDFQVRLGENARREVIQEVSGRLSAWKGSKRRYESKFTECAFALREHLLQAFEAPFSFPVFPTTS